MRIPGFVNCISGDRNNKKGEQVMEDTTGVVKGKSCENYRSECALYKAESGNSYACFIYVVNFVVFDLVEFQLSFRNKK